MVCYLQVTLPKHEAIWTLGRCADTWPRRVGCKVANSSIEKQLVGSAHGVEERDA